MKKKLILSYPSVKCTTKKPWIHASVLQDKDTVYLICDYYKDKAHKYRMAIAPDGYIHYDYEKTHGIKSLCGEVRGIHALIKLWMMMLLRL